jgi:ADP-ribose 1''-phosphate phosphatase
MEVSGPRHFVGCLFTSQKYGRGRDPPQQILKNTVPAMKALLSDIAESGRSGNAVKEIRMCQINSGLFSVPWEQSRAKIEHLKVDESDYEDIPKEIVVYSLPPRK